MKILNILNIKWIVLYFVVLLIGVGLFWHWEMVNQWLSTADSGVNFSAKTQEPASVTESSQPAVRLRFSPDHGQVAVWRFDINAHANIDFAIMQPKISGVDPTTPSGHGERVPVESIFGGELYLKYYSREPGIWNVAGLIRDFDYRINGEKPDFIAAISEPFSFSMTSQGSLGEFSFTRGISEQVIQLVKNTLLGMQIVLSKEGQTIWSSTETDMTGRYRANYHLQKLNAKKNLVVIAKEKQSYLGLDPSYLNANSKISQSTIRLEGAAGKITMAMQGPWLTSMTYKEKTTMMVGSYAWSDAQNETTLTTIERDTRGLFPATFEEYSARLKTDRYLASTYYATDPVLNQLGVNLNVEGAVDLFKKMNLSDDANVRQQAEKFLVNYLRQHPNVCMDLINLMDQDALQERMDQPTQLVFWRLLTEAGHSEAQQAMMNAILDPAKAEVTQTRALINMNAFEYPQPFLADALYGFYKQPPNPTEPPRAEQMRGMALLAMGALGYGEKLNEETKTRVGQLLTQELDNVKTEALQKDVLAAVGNYGDKNMAAKVEPFFSSSTDQIRARAFSAMRRMDDPVVFNTLITHYSQETSTKVRTVALKTIANFTPTQESISWANRNALAVSHPEEQIIMADILGENKKKFPENSQTLQEMLNKNPDNKVKRAIYKYVVPLP